LTEPPRVCRRRLDRTTSEDLQRIKALERENRDLRQANEILRKASALVL